jgi:hypothetical protein
MLNPHALAITENHSLWPLSNNNEQADKVIDVHREILRRYRESLKNAVGHIAKPILAADQAVFAHRSEKYFKIHPSDQSLSVSPP